MANCAAFVRASPMAPRAASVAKVVSARPLLVASSSSRAAQIPDGEPAPSPARRTADCELCVGALTLPCSLCNAFGFIKIDGATDWRACHVCQGRGIVCCPQCCEPGTLPPVHFDD